MTLELGGKSPNIFFADGLDAEDDFIDKALEGSAMFALNQGDVCTCRSRVLVQESIYDRFMERAVARVRQIVEGDPLDPATMIGAQASAAQLAKDPELHRYRESGGDAGPDGRCPPVLPGELAGG